MRLHQIPGRQILGAALLLTLLTALLFGSVDTSAGSYDRSLQTLDRFTRAEAALQRDILLVRTGLLQNYDPLVAALNAIADSLSALQTEIRAEGLDPGPTQALQDVTAKQAGLVERFKSEQALLRNSLAYFPILTAQAASFAGNHALDTPIGALNEAVLRLVLDTSPEVVQAARNRLDALKRLQPQLGPEAETQRMLVRHGELLTRLLPQVDGLLHDLISSPIVTLREAVEMQLQSRHVSLQRRARALRIALYAVSIVLLTRLVFIGLHLRASRLALQEQASIKALVSQISTGFVGCKPERIGDYLTGALGSIGRELGLERVYIIQSEPPGLYLWSRGPGPPPPGWPAAASDIAREAPGVDGVHSIASTQRLPPCETKRRLEAAGVRSWAGIELSHEGESIGLLGFDAAEQGALCPRSGVGSLRPIGRLVEDILQSERAALERDAMQSRLRQAQRLETAGTIASGLAHNFNNIIAAVLGHAEMATERLPAASSAAQHVEEIRRAGERARDLVDRMLRFGRRGTASEAVSMHALVVETVSLLRASLPPGVTLVAEAEDTQALVAGETAQLQQVIVNLVRNAVQAVGESGQVRLRLAVVPVTKAREMPLGTLSPGSYVRLSVRDTGHGMDAETLGRIFEPFFTTRPAGTGLGLATVADILRDHGGALDVASTPGSGTLFEIWLPQSATVATRSEPRLGQGEIVLVIDGDRERLLRTEDMLAALGYEPAGFSDEGEALESLSRAPRHFDVVLLDATRPDQRSAEIAARVHAINAELPVILVGRAADAASLGQPPAQVVETVTPPPTSATLAAALSRCLGHWLNIAAP